jgi:hypothetical protein
MNKIIIALCLVLLGMSGCQKKIADTIDGQTVDQRLSAALTAYQSQLTSAPYGWIVVETTTGTALNAGAPLTGPIAAFAYYMQFDTSNQVTMYADWDTTTARTPRTSSYRIKAVQRPSLIFDTYSYIHLPCDPDPSISLSPFGPGFGWGTDFEFSFADNTPAAQLGDTIHLLGNLNSANAVMIKATQAQQAAYFNGTFANDFIFPKFQNYFKNMTVGSTTVQFTPGIASHILDVSWLNGPGNLKQASTAFYQVADGIGFATPVQVGTQTLTGLQNVVWNSSTGTATVKVNGIGTTLTGVTAPLFYDPNSAADWYLSALNAGGLYLSNNGFHIDGIDDAFQLDTMTFNGAPYFTYVFYPGLINSGALDLFSPFFNTYPDYLSATQSGGDANGIAYFSIFTNGLPMPNAVNAMDSVEGDPNGYYLILKEDGTSYDQVNTTDAKTWISWTFLP